MKRRTLVDEYMNEIIDYGGEDYTRADVIRDMQYMGQSQPEIDRWFQGYELGKELARRRLSHLASAKAVSSNNADNS